MYKKDDGDVDSPVKNSSTLDYQSKPISIKLTRKIEKQLEYLTEQTQMPRSSIIRYSITELYKKIRQEAGDE
ncbi:hypothetical protein [Methanobrevibacter sp.]|uniref:hypothetical protein n=1 Tax=Methanobrevibacter sp. TaxID=66852 RepID=UPI003869713D